MTPLDIDRIRQVDDFESLVVFLRDELEWPLQAEDIEELSFDYEPEELGLSEEVAVKINSIKQLRPLASNQPWGIFYIKFEPKKLPVVVLRRVLQKLVVKKRPGSQKSNIPGWHSNDLLFINSFGQQEERAITFAHFRQEDENQLPTLKVIGWDGQDTPLHLDRCQNELGYLRFNPDIDAEAWKTNWSAAFTTTHRHSINTSKRLAKELAGLAKVVRINAEHILKYETEGGRFKKAMAKFKIALIHDLTEEDFADMYAQTIAYGLLYTAICSHVSGEATVVSAERVQQLVLPTNPFLKEVMEGFFNIGARKWDSEKEMITGIEFDELGINEIITTLKDQRTDFDAILRDFGNKNPNEDPVIHFYELFLKEYDKQKRKSRGVYYTPRPVVSFIVRSVDEVLKRDFGLELGLADTETWGQMHEHNPDIEIPSGVNEDDFFVQILDPALGTGTFLVEVIDTIAITMKTKWGRELGLSIPADPNDVVAWKHPQVLERWNNYVPQCLLPRLYGFELMMAPYAIAHMKIGIKLFETGYENFEKDKKRVQVYLTNTLEEPVDTSGYLDTLDPALALETEQANILKQKNSITVVIGNPPYAGHSFNKGQWIYDLLRKKLVDGADSYFKVDGVDLGERNPKWLNDDYVKFIRYSQYRLASADIGIHGFITNHRYLDNPTFRGMRQSLLKSFTCSHIVNLHGNSLNRETCPDGSIDENVFDIQQGVGIGTFIKKANLEYKGNVYYTDLWGYRPTKFDWLINNEIKTINNASLNPQKPLYEFSIKENFNKKEYERQRLITEIYPVNSVGVLTHRDHFAWDIDENILKKKIKELCSKNISDDQIKNTYSLDNKILERRPDLKIEELLKSIKIGNYRALDKRYIIYHRQIIDRGRWNVVENLIRGENLALIAQRQTYGLDFYHIFCTNIISDLNYISNLGGGTVFPLYLYPVEGELNFTKGTWPAGKNGRTPNLDPKFVEQFAKNISLEFVSDGKGNLKKTFGPEDIFNYIYAVFHSPTYRSRYAEFLKIDFPRVPITSDTDLFKKLCGLGGKVVSLHLMESDKLNNHITTFPISGDNTVTKVGEKKKTLADVEDGKGKLYINKTQYFDNLPEEVWHFHIGGYQVCYKWLYDRKKAGRKLSTDDIDHYHKIVVALNETIKIMKQIDEVIDAHGGWPIQRTPPTGDDTKNPAHR